MAQGVTLKLEDDLVRFTSDGRVAVVDAIGALCAVKCPECVWEELKRRDPRLAELCGGYAFNEEEQVPVAGSETWMRIEGKLLDYLLGGAD